MFYWGGAEMLEVVMTQLLDAKECEHYVAVNNVTDQQLCHFQIFFKNAVVGVISKHALHFFFNNITMTNTTTGYTYSNMMCLPPVD